MEDNLQKYKKEIGNRFRIFRQLVLRTRTEFAEEASLPEEYIAQIEWGTVLPGILSTEFFYKEYGLSITWLVSGEGNIFYKHGTRTPRHAYSIDKKLHYEDPEFHQYLGVVKQLQIPETKQQLLEIMTHISNGYRPYFDQFENQQEKTNQDETPQNNAENTIKLEVKNG
jgi:hypothetical protein